MKAYRFPEYDTPVYIGKNVAVIGGGNVAMDAARCAKRLGAENVLIVYRRGADEMPARSEEIQHAKEEGVAFQLLSNPVRIIGNEDGWATKLECQQMDLSIPDASGRKSVTPIPDSNFTMDADVIIVAIGQTPNPLIRSTTPDLETNQKGCIIVKEETGETSKQGVYAGGDAVTGAATVILAMGAGKTAAQSIDEYLSK
jgi:glutamate synthase (NADPH/NADH) small chain